MQQLRSAMREKWGGVKCVFTDGDQAMAAALASTMPHSKHLRCRYHLKTNLQGKLQQLKVDKDVSKQCVDDWQFAAARETQAEFDEAIAAMIVRCPAIQSYMMDTFPPSHVYADYSLNHLTALGVRTTARVESWNSTLKGMLAVNNTTPMAQLFESLRYALSEKDHLAKKRAMEDAARRPINTRVRTICWSITERQAGQRNHR
jgi:transposase-like protein